MLLKTSKMVGIGLIFMSIGLPQIYQAYSNGKIGNNYPNINQSGLYLEANFSVAHATPYLPLINGDTLFSSSSPGQPEKPKEIIARNIVVTAYSSDYWQTDDSPFITASGTTVRDGVIAANFLPFGAIVKLPELFGDKEFAVEDRMNKRYWYRIDIWMPNYSEASNFGAKYTEAVIEI